MRTHLLITFLLAFHIVNGQPGDFPLGWTGHWKGELLWYKRAGGEPQRVPMELRIAATEKPDSFAWQIIYGSESKDNRPYTLVAKDKSRGHWAIDENNGILLDQFWIGQRFCGSFTVGKSTILNSYWMEGDKLVAEFYSMSNEPLATTGEGTDESPKVRSYSIGSYQKAILARQ